MQTPEPIPYTLTLGAKDTQIPPPQSVIGEEAPDKCKQSNEGVLYWQHGVWSFKDSTPVACGWGLSSGIKNLTWAQDLVGASCQQGPSADSHPLA